MSSGRGLMMIELLAHAWGVVPRGESKNIWYEVYECPDTGGWRGAV